MGESLLKTIDKPWIKLKELLDEEDYKMIYQLQKRCIQHDQTALKLELDYKLGVSQDSSKGFKSINEFMYFDGQQLIGYMGICNFGGPWEVNGMVDPDYRRQGVFTKLYDLVLDEWSRKKSGSVLLLSDRTSESGQAFIAGTGAQYKHSEYEMFLGKNAPIPAQEQLAGLTFRKAANTDAKEIARQNAIYFNDETEVESEDDLDSKVLGEGNEELDPMVLPEEEEKRGMTCYLVEKDGEIIGKVNLQLTSKLGAIFGLGVLPEHRRKGYGRALLLMAIEKLKEANAQEIMLQVAAENANALNLYKSCGFEETSTMDYYYLENKIK
jgi:ribosomal protein S18 acetylase RimI-like enzyme